MRQQGELLFKKMKTMVSKNEVFAVILLTEPFKKKMNNKDTIAPVIRRHLNSRGGFFVPLTEVQGAIILLEL